MHIFSDNPSPSSFYSHRPTVCIVPVVKGILFRVKQFLVSRTHSIRVQTQLSKEFRVTSGVPHGSVLCPLLFLAYVNDIWMNIDSTIRLFADDYIIYRKIVNNTDVENLQMDLDSLEEWAVDNAMKISSDKSTAVRFTRAWVNSLTLQMFRTGTLWLSVRQ